MFNLSTIDIKRLTNDGRSKNSICRDSFAKIFCDVYGLNKFDIFDKDTCLRRCRFGERCVGSHSLEDLYFSPHNSKFAVSDKKKIDFVQIYVDIINVFDREMSKVINPELKSRIENYKRLDFFQLMNLWYDLACYHRGLIKNFSEADDECGFDKIADIPQFKVQNEDTVWAFERLTKYCGKYKDFEERIRLGGKKINIKEICNHGAFNCKHGVHNESFLICRDDFLTGKCKCKSIKFVEERKNELEELLNSKDDEFVTKRSKNVTRKLREEYEMLNNYQRNVHFTDDPEFVPFNVKLKEYHKKQELLRKEKEMADTLKIEKEKSRQEHLSTASIKQKRVMKPSFKK